MKKELGAKCTFLSYSKEKIQDKNGEWKLKDCILVYFKNDKNGVDKIRVPLPKSFNNLNLDDWNFIYNELREVRDGERS